MSLNRFAPTVVLSLLVLVPSLASADIAPPRPEDLNCRPGTVATTPTIEPGATDPRGRPLRPYPYCAARPACTDDAACDGGMVCSPEPIGFCLEQREVAPGETVGVPRQRGCEPDGTCLNINSTCEQVRRCVPPDSPQAAASEPASPAADEPAAETPPADEPAEEPAEEPESSSGCSVSQRGSSSGAILLGLPLAWLFVRRRRA